MVAAKLRSIDEALRERHNASAGFDGSGVDGGDVGGGGGGGVKLVKVCGNAPGSDGGLARSDLSNLLRLARTPSRRKNAPVSAKGRAAAQEVGSRVGARGGGGSVRVGREVATCGSRAVDAGGDLGGRLQEDVSRLLRPVVRIRRGGVEVQ